MACLPADFGTFQYSRCIPDGHYGGHFLIQIGSSAEKVSGDHFPDCRDISTGTGAGVYWTAYYIVTDQLRLAAETGYTAVKVAVAIVLGIVFIFELPQGLFVRLAGNK